MTPEEQKELNYETGKAIAYIWMILKHMDPFDQKSMERLGEQIAKIAKFTERE